MQHDLHSQSPLGLVQYFKFMEKYSFPPVKIQLCYSFALSLYECATETVNIINRPGVAGAVLQSPP